MRIVKARAIADLPEYEGAFVPFKLAKSGKTIIGFCFASDSPAKQEGIDVIFTTCSSACVSALQVAVQQEIDGLRLVNEPSFV